MMRYFAYGYPMMGFNPGWIIMCIVGLILVALLVIVFVSFADIILNSRRLKQPDRKILH